MNSTANIAKLALDYLRNEQHFIRSFVSTGIFRICTQLAASLKQHSLYDLDKSAWKIISISIEEDAN